MTRLLPVPPGYARSRGMTLRLEMIYPLPRSFLTGTLKAGPAFLGLVEAVAKGGRPQRSQTRAAIAAGDPRRGPYLEGRSWRPEAWDEPLGLRAPSCSLWVSSPPRLVAVPLAPSPHQLTDTTRHEPEAEEGNTVREKPRCTVVVPLQSSK